MAKRVLTTGDIARYCGVNFRTVIRWIERGLLTAYQLPGRGDNRVTAEDFLDFLKANRMPVPEELGARSRRVLVVDDDPAMANAIRRVLRKAGYETRVASNGFTAGTLLGTFSPDVVTLDLKMPGIHGREVLRLIRESESLRDVRVLVVSAMPDEELRAAVEAGADDFLAKPFEGDAILEKVEALNDARAQKYQRGQRG